MEKRMIDRSLDDAARGYAFEMDTGDYDTNKDIFIDGANWAIDKACEWLKSNTYSLFVKSCSLYDAVEEFTENFKQAMKGGGNEN